MGPPPRGYSPGAPTASIGGCEALLLDTQADGADFRARLFARIEREAPFTHVRARVRVVGQQNAATVETRLRASRQEVLPTTARLDVSSGASGDSGWIDIEVRLDEPTTLAVVAIDFRPDWRPPNPFWATSVVIVDDVSVR